MDQEALKRVLEGVAVALVEDAIDGEAKQWPLVEKALDDAFDGNILTERVADYVTGHEIRDLYAKAVARGHEKIVALKLEGESKP